MSEVAQGWRRVIRIAGIVWFAWAVITSLVAGEVIPFVVIMAAVMVVAWLAAEWRPNRITFTVFGVLSLLILLLNIPFVATDLAHPESAIGFNTTAATALAAIAGTLAGLSVWWNALAGKVASRTLLVLGGLFLVGLVVSVIGALGLKSDTAQAGDLDLVAHRADYLPEALTAAPGTVGVFVENQDAFRHTFTITALGVDVEIPASTNRRIELELPAGAYQFHCTVPGHEDMTGTITVG